MYDDGTIIDYFFFIFFYFFNPRMDVYKNIICLHKEGYSRGQLFGSDSFHSILWSMSYYSFHSILWLMSYYSFTGNKTFNFSITLKDTELLEHTKNTDNKINTVQTFKSNECVICLTNQPNVLFCNCGHMRRM